MSDANQTVRERRQQLLDEASQAIARLGALLEEMKKLDGSDDARASQSALVEEFARSLATVREAMNALGLR